MQFMERVTGMFTRPEETIKDILKEPRTEEALMIVGIVAILAFIASSLSVLRGGGVTAVMNGLLFLVVALVGWPIATGVVHAFALFLGGDGKYNPRMLNAIGYTYVVKIIPMIVGIILLFFVPVASQALTTPQFTPNMSMDDIKAVMQPYISAMEQELFSPAFILYLLVTYLALVWSCYLGALAVKEGDKLSKISAYIAVFVPMAISIVTGIGMVYGSYLAVKMMYG